MSSWVSKKRGENDCSNVGNDEAKRLRLTR
jgi:hypothetical protein